MKPVTIYKKQIKKCARTSTHVSLLDEWLEFTSIIDRFAAILCAQKVSAKRRKKVRQNHVWTHSGIAYGWNFFKCLTSCSLAPCTCRRLPWQTNLLPPSAFDANTKKLLVLRPPEVQRWADRDPFVNSWRWVYCNDDPMYVWRVVPFSYGLSDWSLPSTKLWPFEKVWPRPHFHLNEKQISLQLCLELISY